MTFLSCATNQEINEAVAKKLGWHRKNSDVWISPKQANGNDYLCSDIPPYCEYIEAAWEIVEHCAMVTYIQRAAVGGKEWHVDIGNMGWTENDNVCRAICEAFLKLP